MRNRVISLAHKANPMNPDSFFGIGGNCTNRVRFAQLITYRLNANSNKHKSGLLSCLFATQTNFLIIS